MKAERIAEISTIVFAIAILVFLGALSFQYLGYISHGSYIPSNETAIPIKVIAKQYVWEFIYPNGTVSYNKVVIQAGKPYVFQLTSADVIHAFYIVQLGMKMQAIPGYTYDLYVLVNQPGVYNIWCAEFCGPGHYTMKGIMIVTNSTG
ncbi:MULTISPECIES: cytochrome c oxidase subunit II [Metallosphaera]|uniref:cytochrome c oxidase subunit II n=1 Tax=Metallosphaera TaxID=41980 RepID=UPI001F058965|nr:cytochrome c oxidase subunit II [Metallosphaera sedula]MCH1771081.1 cytochrome c oxidase subunit II [Metallosphaera sedula]MCP6729451.1 cytochrome c oxidase subunit II [Metallosphaera sedula]